MAKWVPPTEQEKEQIKSSNAVMTEDQKAQDDERRKAVRLALRARGLCRRVVLEGRCCLG